MADMFDGRLDESRQPHSCLFSRGQAATLREHTYMTSAMGGGRRSPNADEVREVAWK